MRLRYSITLFFLMGAFLVHAHPAQAQTPTFFTAQLTADESTGEVESDGMGTAALALTDEGLRFFVTVDGLTGDIANAHFHQSPIGVAGGVVRGIMDDFDGNTASGIWTAADDEPLNDEMMQALFEGDLYINIHTAEYGGGEIRGQVLPTSGAALTGTLTAAQAGQDIESEGSGTAHVQLTNAGAIYYVTVDNLTGPTQNAHFHEAPIGENGGVVHGIFDNFENGTAFGLWSTSGDGALTPELIETLLSGGLYFNFHTAEYGGGEIRGQLLPSSGWGFHADLDTEQVVGEIESDGSGTGTFTLTDAGLIYQVTVDGLTGPITNAHFHRAPAGENGGVVHGIFDNFDGNTSAGLWSTSDDAEPLTPELIRDLIAGNLYVNIHTDEYGGGEIRGQVLLREGAELTARLTAAQEPGDVTSDGSGTAALSLTDDGLAFRVTVSGLTGDIANAHFHREEIGVNGGVERGIMDDFDGNTAAGMWTAADDEALTEELITALLQGELYINIHTAEFGGGEIRGQVLPSEGAGLRAFLTNEAVTSDVEQEGSGVAAMTLTDQGLVYDLTVTNLTGEIQNAHFHTGAIGVDGGVVHGIFDNFNGNTAAGVWRSSGDGALTAEDVEALVNGELYLNIHTAEHGGGEIRGQVLVSSGVGAAVQLDAEQSGEDVMSDGTGTASLSLTQAGLVYALTATGLTGPITNAHFHNAPLGENGGVVHGIFDEFEANTATGIWRPADDEPLTTDMMQELLAGNIYINLHTDEYGGGEIRGQVLPGDVVATAIEPVSGEVPGAFRLEENYPNPFNPATTIEFALTNASRAVLDVYDVLGRHVATLVDEPLAAGEYRVQFDGSGLPSGVYVYRLSTADRQATRSMLLLK